MPESPAPADGLPQIMGAAEIRTRLGLGRQSAAKILRRTDFPAPVGELRSGPVWLARDVEGWISANWRDRRPREP
jgi:hypothetical protein